MTEENCKKIIPDAYLLGISVTSATDKWRSRRFEGNNKGNIVAVCKADWRLPLILTQDGDCYEFRSLNPMAAHVSFSSTILENVIQNALQEHTIKDVYYVEDLREFLISFLHAN